VRSSYFGEARRALAQGRRCELRKGHAALPKPGSGRAGASVLPFRERMATLRAMPATYFAHQLFVLPFKIARPRWFDGSALCIGSMAPDFMYALSGTPLGFSSHVPLAHLTWSLPVTLLLTRLVRRYLAEPIGAQLPDPIGCEVRALASSVHPLAITVMSALLGSISHVFVDSFTHRHGWGYEHFAVLHRVIFPDWQLADVLQYIGHSFGSALGLLWFSQLCAQHRVSRWNGSRHAPSRYAPAPWFWPALHASAGLCGALLLLCMLRGDGLPVAIMRSSCVAFGILCLIAFAVRREQQIALDR
jgi:hypothetical protein